MENEVVACLGEAGPAGPASERVCQTLPPFYTVLHYLVLTLGVLAKFFLQAARGEGRLNWATVACSVILSAIIFPFVYRKVCGRNGRDPMQFFISFQHGFFFQTILEQVQALL